MEGENQLINLNLGGSSAEPPKPAPGAKDLGSEFLSVGPLPTGKIDPVKAAATAPHALNSIAEAKGTQKKFGFSLPSFFQKKAEATVEGPKIMESIVAQKKAPTGGNAMPGSLGKTILGSNNDLQKSLEQDKELHLKKKLKNSKVTLIACFVLAAVSTGYFFMELSPNFDLFGENTTTRLTNLNKNLRSLQSKINVSRYLAAQIDLNSFSLLSDEFLEKTATMADKNASSFDQTEAAQRVTELTPKMASLIERIKGNLDTDIVVPTTKSLAEEEQTPAEMTAYFQNELKTALSKDRSELLASSKEVDNSQDIRLYDNTLKLVGNTNLFATIKSLSPDKFQTQLDTYIQDLDPDGRQAIKTLFTKILSSTKSDVAIIGTIKGKRIEWSKVRAQLNMVRDETLSSASREVSSRSTIVYTGFEFNANNNRITLSGTTTTDNALNFTLMSRLIDNLEDDSFDNVEMRSFTKTGDEEGVYTADFKIDLTLVADELGKLPSIDRNLPTTPTPTTTSLF